MSLKCVNGKKIIGNTSASVWQKACDEGWCVTACVWRVDHQRRQRWRRRVGARRVTAFRKKYIFLMSFRHTKEYTQYLPSIRDEIEIEKGLTNQRGEIYERICVGWCDAPRGPTSSEPEGKYTNPIFLAETDPFTPNNPVPHVYKELTHTASQHISAQKVKQTTGNDRFTSRDATVGGMLLSDALPPPVGPPRPAKFEPGQLRAT